MKNEFAQFVIEQLREVPVLRARRMFGSMGLYSGEKFFGIISEGRVYFKTSDKNRADYTAGGMAPFRASDTQTLVNYYEVPPDVIENPDELARWAAKSIATRVDS